MTGCEVNGEVELFYDDTPGERRGMVARNGRFEQILIQREGDPEGTRLGARSVGRVVAVEPGLSGGFVDLGGGAALAFLPFERNQPLTIGQALEVVVTAESRENKGAVVRRIGSAEGTPRLLQAAPDLLDELAALAPGVEVQAGAAAIRATWEAEEEALGAGGVFAAFGLDLAVQRTRALIAVDIDFAPQPGRDGRKGRAAANREGLRQAARLIRLRRWGGLVVVDLAGAVHDGDGVAARAREAFAWAPDAAWGPVSRFGLMQLSLPWRRTPIEETLGVYGSERALQTEGIALTRRLRHAILTDTASPRLTARCRPGLALRAAPLIARLGPRAALRRDEAVRAGDERIEEN